MGYDTYIHGSFTITPQIPESEWPAAWTSQPLGSMEGDYVLGQQGGTETLEIVDGNLTVVGDPGCTVAEWRWEESASHYGRDENLMLLIEWAKSKGCTVNGYLSVSGEEDGDLSRMVVTDNVFETVRPKIVWPDGSEGL